MNATTAPVALGGPLVVWDGLFAPRELDAIVRLGDGLTQKAAELVAQNNADRKRITRVAWIGRDPASAWLHARLEEAVLTLNARFYKYDLFGLNERLQYTVYDGSEGGHYDWHVDHGAATAEPRKLSLSLQLSDPADYEDCTLELSYGDGTVAAPRGRGTLIAFPSYVLHRVTPVRTGTRKSLVIWASGPDFR